MLDRGRFRKGLLLTILLHLTVLPVVRGEIVWSTFLGGSDHDESSALAIDTDGNIVIGGSTSSNDFPTDAGAYDRSFNGGQNDLFIGSISSDGSSLRFATYIGGNAYDRVNDITITGDGSITLAGWTESQNFPVTEDSYDESFNGGSSDGFLLQISADGRQLHFSSYLGGSGTELIYSLALVPEGSFVVAGWSESWNYPVTDGSFDESYNDVGDIIVSLLSRDGSRLLHSTFAGGNAGDMASDLIVRNDGSIILTGLTNSDDFPTSEDAYDRSHNGSGDAILIGLSPNLDRLIFSTLMGGADADQPKSVVSDNEGGWIISGETYSNDLPTSENAYDRVYNGGMIDIFVSRFSEDGSRLIYSTFLGGDNLEIPECAVSDGSGGIILTGESYSSNFPVTDDAYDPSYNGGTIDCFVARLSPDGTRLIYSSYIGGSSNDLGMKIVNDGFGTLVISGVTASQNFPVTEGAYDRNFNSSEAFLLSFDLGLPAMRWLSFPDHVSGVENEELSFVISGVSLTDNPDYSLDFYCPELPEGPQVIDNNGGVFRFVWHPGYTDAGYYEIEFTFSDGESDLTRTAQVSIFNVNRSPEWVEVPEEIVVEEGDPVAFIVRASDLDGDNLALASSSEDLPESWSFIANQSGEGSFLWFTNDQDSGTYHVNFVARDSSSEADAQTVIRVLEPGSVAAKNELPVDFTLQPCYPNPFNSTTTVRFGLPNAGEVNVSVWDLSGHKMADLGNGKYGAGYHEVVWKAGTVPGGTYLVKLEASGVELVQKVVVAR